MGTALEEVEVEEFADVEGKEVVADVGVMVVLPVAELRPDGEEFVGAEVEEVGHLNLVM